MKKVMALLCSFIAALACVLCGCGTQNDPQQLAVGTVSKSYALYEPISNIENITCDLYYKCHLDPEAACESQSSNWTIFGKRTVDAWKTFKLVECDDGPFTISYNTTFNRFSEPRRELYDKTVQLNISGLEEERLYFVSEDILIDQNGEISKEEPSYYCTWVVEPMNTITPARVWLVRIYVLFWDSENTVSLHEYTLHLSYYTVSGDEFLQDRLTHQKYTPAS